jgi:hypothetical protein
MRRLFAALGIGLLASLTIAGTASADPPGNNGTVKIEGTDLDSIPDNNPHQGCIFTIEFRGYDEGDLTATYSLDAQAPSGSGQITSGSVDIGEDPAGGATDLDAVVTIDLSAFDLSSFFEHPQQGFHVKLTVHAEGSIGADVKHKVFWVTGCPPYPLTPTGGIVNPAQTDASLPGPASPALVLGMLLGAVGVTVGLTSITRRRLAARRPRA